VNDGQLGLFAPRGEPEPKTLAQARAEVRDGKDEGVICPCCDQRAQRYRRTLYAGMARSLVLIYQAQQKRIGWVDVKEIDVRGGDYAKLAYWGLVKQRELHDVDGDVRSSAHWRVTAEGELFVRGKLSVPRQVLVYNGKCEGYVDSSDRVDIRQALGKKFSYTELMGTT
jgi:hypothetical protein